MCKLKRIGVLLLALVLLGCLLPLTRAAAEDKVPALILGEETFVELGTEESAWFVFTPSKSGYYKFFGSGSTDWDFNFDLSGPDGDVTEAYSRRWVDNGSYQLFYLKAGKQYVVRVYEGFRSATFGWVTVTKNPVVKSVAFEKEAYTLFIDKAAGGRTASTLYYDFTPEGSFAKIKSVVSSNANVVRVGEFGFNSCSVMPMKTGTATLTVTTENGKTASVKVTVKNAPAFKTRLENMLVKEGYYVYYKADCAGTELKYQWQYRTSSTASWKNCTESSATSSYYYFTAKTDMSTWQYRCKITDKLGTVAYSNVSTLYVLGVTEHPKDEYEKPGDTAVFTVTAKGLNKKYQWEYWDPKTGEWKNATAEGNKTRTLKVPVTLGRHNFYYRCKVTDEAGNYVCSDFARLHVLGFKTQPETVQTYANDTAHFGVSMLYYGDYTYQWQYKTSAEGKWLNCTAEGAKTNSLWVAATTGKSSYYYRCRVKDVDGNTIYSKVVRLYVLGIKSQPKDRTAAVGDTVKFTVSATGLNKKYQWQYMDPDTGVWQNTTLKGNKTATLTVTAKASRNGFRYRCIITDEAGHTVTTNSAMLTVK